MFKCTILRIVLAHFELDVSNMSHKRWESTFSLLVATVWELRTPAAELLGEECCLIQDSSCLTVLGLLFCIFHVMIHQGFQFVKGLDCKKFTSAPGLFHYGTMLL